MRKIGFYLHKSIQLCFVGIFLLILSLPLSDPYLALAPKVNLSENRVLTPFPAVVWNYSGIESFISGFEKYYQDNFGFRKLLIQLHTIIKTKVFRTSPNNKVLIGKNDWLYFTGEDESFRRFQPVPSANELQLVTDSIDNRKTWFDAHGISFFVMVVPNKQSIYPEYLPEPQNKWIYQNTYDEFFQYYQAHSTANAVVDVKTDLLREKALGQSVYYKTDSHWNHYAAWLAYSRLMSSLQSHPYKVNIKKYDDFIWAPRTYAGDLVTYQLGIDGLYQEQALFASLKDSPCSTQHSIDQGLEFAGAQLSYPLIISECTSANTGSVVVLRDSQFIPILPWFAESFSRVVYVNYWEKQETLGKIIEMEKPGLVVHVLVERNFGALRQFAPRS